MLISVIGGGNGGQTMAAHFSLLGHRVILYNRTPLLSGSLRGKRKIILDGAIRGESELCMVTSNIEEAISGADLIMVTTTADAHRDVAEKMAPFLRDGQVVVLNPGRTMGAWEFASVVRSITLKRVYIAEAQSLIYACRIEGPGQIRVIGVKKKVLLSALPHNDTDYVLNILNAVYPCFVRASSVLETSLENIGAILHPAVILFNTAAIERGQSFRFYSEMTPAIAGFLEQIDGERLSIGEAFGLKLKSVSDWVSYAYCNISGETLCEKIRDNPAYYNIMSPDTLYSRLLLEDMPTGILPMIELGRLAGIKTDLMESLLHIAGALLNIDFRGRGRTLQNLGIEGYTKEELIEKF